MCIYLWVSTISLTSSYTNVTDTSRGVNGASLQRVQAWLLQQESSCDISHWKCSRQGWLYVRSSKLQNFRPSTMCCDALYTGLLLNTHKIDPEARVQIRLGHHLDLPAVTSLHQVLAGKRASLRSSAHLSNIAGIAVTHILADVPMT